MKGVESRIEKDSMGEMSVPKDALHVLDNPARAQ